MIIIFSLLEGLPLEKMNGPLDLTSGPPAPLTLDLWTWPRGPMPPHPGPVDLTLWTYAPSPWTCGPVDPVDLCEPTWLYEPVDLTMWTSGPLGLILWTWPCEPMDLSPLWTYGPPLKPVYSWDVGTVNKASTCSALDVLESLLNKIWNFPNNRNISKLVNKSWIVKISQSSEEMWSPDHNWHSLVKHSICYIACIFKWQPKVRSWPLKMHSLTGQWGKSASPASPVPPRVSSHSQLSHPLCWNRRCTALHQLND